MLDEYENYILEEIGVFRDESEAKRIEHERQVKARVLESVYRVARVARVETYTPQGEPFGYADQVQEIYPVTLRAMAEFAKEHRVNIDELKAVVESRAKEVTGRGGERLQAYPSLYDDRKRSEEDIKDDREDKEEDKRLFAWSKRTAENRKKYTPQEPVVHELMR